MSFKVLKISKIISFLLLFQTLGLVAQNVKVVDSTTQDSGVIKIERDSLTSTIRVLPFKFNTQYYSFGVPKGSKLVDEINPILLETIEDVQWKGVLSDYDLADF